MAEPDAAGREQRPAWTHSPVAPALIALLGTIAGLIMGAGLDWWKSDLSRATADRDREVTVASLKWEIIKAVKDFDRPTAEVLLEHSVKPIDSPDRYTRFNNQFQNLLASRQASEDSRAPALNASTGETSTPPDVGNPAGLVALFPGPDRGLASEQLVKLHGSQPDQVVEALVRGILPPSDPKSYRVNLYVAYTLARIEPHWSGSSTQFEAVRLLTQQKSNYSEPTFKRRVDEAIENFAPKR